MKGKASKGGCGSGFCNNSMSAASFLTLLIRHVQRKRKPRRPSESIHYTYITSPASFTSPSSFNDRFPSPFSHFLGRHFGSRPFQASFCHYNKYLIIYFCKDLKSARCGAVNRVEQHVSEKLAHLLRVARLAGLARLAGMATLRWNGVQLTQLPGSSAQFGSVQFSRVLSPYGRDEMRWSWLGARNEQIEWPLPWAPLEQFNAPWLWLRICGLLLKFCKYVVQFIKICILKTGIHISDDANTTNFVLGILSILL